jgi:hypothetical protein
VSDQNPILEQLDVIEDTWTEFAETPGARLLCLELRHDETRLFDAFIARELEERAAELPDLFLTLETPFEHLAVHGFALQQTLTSEYQSAQPGLAAEGVAATWSPPVYLDRAESDVAFFARTCESFHQHHAVERHLAVVLRPSVVADVAVYRQWLQKLLSTSAGHVRFVALDSAGAPELRVLAEAEPARAKSRRPALDMPGAIEALSQNAGNLDTPGGQYRDLFVRLGSQLAKQDLARATELGAAALAIAAAQSWFHLAVPIHFALAAGFTSAGRFADSLACFKNAEHAALRGQSEGPEEARPVCRPLRLHARLGQGSTLFAAQAWDAAARHYEETAPVAVEYGDPRTELDCHRLASFAHERAGRDERAFQVGLNGLGVARTMDKELLASSTFPYLGVALLRLCEAPSRRDLAPQIEQQIVTIAGTPDWRPKAPSAGGAAA